MQIQAIRFAAMIGILLVSLRGAHGAAAGFKIVQIAETGVAVGDTEEVFQAFEPPVVRGDRLIYSGRIGKPPTPEQREKMRKNPFFKPPSRLQMYEHDLGDPKKPRKVLVTGTELRPSRGLREGEQMHPHTPYLVGDDFAFTASYRDPAVSHHLQHAICVMIDGKLQICADCGTPFPGKIRHGRGLIYIHPGLKGKVILHGKAVYFQGESDVQTSIHWGVYKWQEGKITAIADGQAGGDRAPAPSGGTNLSKIPTFGHDGRQPWFLSKGGFYRSDDKGHYELAFDAHEAFPKSYDYDIIGSLNGKLVARLTDWIYFVDEGEFSAAIPRENVRSPLEGIKPKLAKVQNFSSFGDDFAVKIVAIPKTDLLHPKPPGEAILVIHNGKPAQVVSTGVKVADGKTLREFKLGPQAYDGKRIAFVATYGKGADRRMGVFVAEPGDAVAAGGIGPDGLVSQGQEVDGRLRKWVSADGKFQVYARLRKIDQNGVVLRTRDARTITVPLDKLSESDRRYVNTQLKAAPSER